MIEFHASLPLGSLIGFSSHSIVMPDTDVSRISMKLNAGIVADVAVCILCVFPLINAAAVIPILGSHAGFVASAAPEINLFTELVVVDQVPVMPREPES